MKSLTFCCLLFWFNYHAHAQLAAIGPFVPGKTTTKVIDSIASAHGIKPQQTADVSEIRNTDLSGKTAKVFEILHSCEHNDSVVYSYGNPIHADHSIYQIDYLGVATLLFSNVELHFWKDTLYSIQFDINIEPFTKAITQKYGEGIVAKTETKRKNIVCRDDTGASLNLEEVRTTAYYKTPKDISAWITQSKFYNVECEAVYTSYFMLMNTKTDEWVQARERDIEANHRKSSKN